jgi:hypothetical protein
MDAGIQLAHLDVVGRVPCEICGCKDVREFSVNTETLA